MKLPAIPPEMLMGGGAGLVIGTLINLLALGQTWYAAVVLAALSAAGVYLWLWRRQVNRNRRSFNCASCGQHHPTPSVLVTLGGTFEAEDATHAGVCVVWCKACAAEDVLHAATLRHVHNNDVPELMVVLAALAHRGPGRINWMSQDTLDRMRKINNMPVHPVTSERTVH